MTEREELHRQIVKLAEIGPLNKFEALVRQLDPAAQEDVRQHIEERVSKLKALLARQGRPWKPN
jgi:hypothetical protein